MVPFWFCTHRISTELLLCTSVLPSTQLQFSAAGMAVVFLDLNNTQQSSDMFCQWKQYISNVHSWSLLRGHAAPPVCVVFRTEENSMQAMWELSYDGRHQVLEVPDSNVSINGPMEGSALCMPQRNIMHRCCRCCKNIQSTKTQKMSFTIH